MPFWKKVFAKKSSSSSPNQTNKSSKDKRSVVHTTEVEEPRDSPAGEKRNLQYNLSVSRSGRYKSKERKRGALLEDPGFYDNKKAEDGSNAMTSGGSSSPGSGGNCRSLETRLPSGPAASQQAAAAT